MTFRNRPFHGNLAIVSRRVIWIWLYFLKITISFITMAETVADSSGFAQGCSEALK